MAKKQRTRKKNQQKKKSDGGSSAAVSVVIAMVVVAVAVVCLGNPLAGTSGTSASASPTADVVAEAPAEAKAEAKAEPKQEPKSEPKSEPRPEPKPEPKAEHHDESRSAEPKPKTEHKDKPAAKKNESNEANPKSSAKQKPSTKQNSTKHKAAKHKETKRKQAKPKSVKRRVVRKRVKQHISNRFDGIDVSRHQGWIDWKKIAQNKKIKFVYIKATEGATRQDVYYSSNISRARKAHVRVGSYHYMTAKFSVHRQFQNFKKTVKKGQQDLIPMIDIEEEGMRRWSKRQIQDSLQVLIDLMKRYYGKAPIIYSQYNFYNKNLAPRFNRYYLFIARYHTDAPPLKGHGKHNIWQYTQHGRVAGIDGYVDLDRFVGGSSLRDLRLR